MKVIDVIDQLESRGCHNGVILDAMLKSYTIINKPQYKTVMLGISGGSDSDVMLDMVLRVTKDKSKLRFVFFDTGIEYKATRDHLDFLENKYRIKIDRVRSEKTVPYCCKHYGQPFISKQVSIYIDRLQHHGFQWEDEDFVTLVKRYCKKADDEKKSIYNEMESEGKTVKSWVKIDSEWYSGCMSALRWWCCTKSEGKSRFDISRNKWLKEFIIENPPFFKISPLCCDYAKKKVSKNYITENRVDLLLLGLREREGGLRSTAYKSCYSVYEDRYDTHRPIFYFNNDDKEEYEKVFGIVNSRCYSEYGLKRTGCVGCPFGRDIQKELSIICEHEPKLLLAVNNVFMESYEYTHKYREFQKMMNEKERLK